MRKRVNDFDKQIQTTIWHQFCQASKGNLLAALVNQLSEDLEWTIYFHLQRTKAQ